MNSQDLFSIFLHTFGFTIRWYKEDGRHDYTIRFRVLGRPTKMPRNWGRYAVDCGRLSFLFEHYYSR